MATDYSSGYASGSKYVERQNVLTEDDMCKGMSSEFRAGFRDGLAACPQNWRNTLPEALVCQIEAEIQEATSGKYAEGQQQAVDIISVFLYSLMQGKGE